MRSNWIALLNFDCTDLCMRHIRHYLAEAPTDFGLVLIDNGSSEKERDALVCAVRAGGGAVIDANDRSPRDLPLILIISDHNRGYAGGNNLALRWCTAQAGESAQVLICNPDVDIDTAVARALFADPGDVVGPAIFEDYIGGFRTPDTYCDFETGFVVGASAAGRPCVGARLQGSCFKISGSALRRFGYLPAPCFLYEEETFYFAAVHRAGSTPTYRSDISVRHRGSMTIGKRSFTYFYYIARNKVRFFWLHGRARPLAWVRFLWNYGDWFSSVAFSNLRARNRQGLRGLALGLWHGLLGRAGPHPSAPNHLPR